MRAWRYTAYTAEGKRRSGTLVAETEASAMDDLKRQGLFVSELEASAAAKSGFALRARSARLSADLQAVFTRQMAVLLTAELTAEAALEAVRSSGKGSAIDPVAAAARAGLMDGQSLSEALENSGAGFPRYYTASLRAGEQAGDVATVFSSLADHLEASGAEKAEIASALIYPAFVAAVSVLVCAILMTSVAPQIVEMFALSGQPLPQITRVVLAISDWIEANLISLAAALIGVLVLAVLSGRIAWLKDYRDRVALRLPLVGRLMRLSASVQYLRTLALVLGSRHAAIAAAQSAGGVLDVSRFRNEADAVCDAIRTGESLSQSMLRLSFVPPVARQLVEAGEMSARLARMAERAAVLVENGLRAERKSIASLLEPLLMVLVGAMVLIIVLAVLLPIFDLQAVVAS